MINVAIFVFPFVVTVGCMLSLSASYVMYNILSLSISGVSHAIGLKFDPKVGDAFVLYGGHIGFFIGALVALWWIVTAELSGDRKPTIVFFDNKYRIPGLSGLTFNLT